MPLEGHYRRVNRPLRKLNGRETKVLVAVGAVTLIAILALVFVPSRVARPLAPGKGCLEVGVAGRVGNEPVTGCGEEARAICRRATGYDDERARAIVRACEEQGIRFR